jgi:16S rRNA (cytidine1402-2'-O)-methyltransferase
MPNHLYVVGAPAGSGDDLTLRARRILASVACVAAPNAIAARRLLAYFGIETPVVDAGELPRIWEALTRGSVALLSEGHLACLSGPGLRLIRIALERGFPVVPVPGPALPITALVISGLAADTFLFLGALPVQTAARSALLASVTAEHRTLVALESSGRLSGTLADLEATLGDRPLSVVNEPSQGPGWTWRGTVAEALAGELLDVPQGECILVIGGAAEEAARWDEDRMRAEISVRLERGLRAREISLQLAAESGWPRREIYRHAVEIGRFRSDR